MKLTPMTCDFWALSSSPGSGGSASRSPQYLQEAVVLARPQGLGSELSEQAIQVGSSGSCAGLKPDLQRWLWKAPLPTCRDVGRWARAQLCPPGGPREHSFSHLPTLPPQSEPSQAGEQLGRPLEVTRQAFGGPGPAIRNPNWEGKQGCWGWNNIFRRFSC